MKLILSRKGFDSSFGGRPSPILPDGRLVSFPIPSKDNLHYSDLSIDKNLTYKDLMKSLFSTYKLRGQRHQLTKHSNCHLDPDLNKTTIPRERGWRPVFGQVGAAQTHLENQGIQEDDLFLFFGKFRETEYKNAKLTYVRGSKPKHVIFGFLQVGEILNVKNEVKFPKWMWYHSHLNNPVKLNVENNTLYVSRPTLTFNKNQPGAGVFDFHDNLVLTKHGYSMSRWDLPRFFKKVKISHHSAKSWHRVYFQSAAIGQEFVVKGEINIKKWINNLMKTHLTSK